MQKPHKNGVLAYLRFYCCYDFLVVMTYSLKPRVGRLNRFKDLLGIESKILAKVANERDEIVRMCELLYVLEALPQLLLNNGGRTKRG